jgi:predicted glutamine amidotransferase
MCLLIIKPKFAEFPPIEYMENAFYSNSDGFGYACQYEKHVEIRKGYMSINSMLQRYEKILQQNEIERNFIFHFRIGTHGKKRSASHCHPFPVSHDSKLLQSKRVISKYAIAHNGMMHGLNSDNFSDTMLFSDKILTDILEFDPFIEKDISINLINNVLGYGKLAIMTEKETLLYFGEFENVNDCLYSNSSYKSYTKYTDNLDYPFWTNEKEDNGIYWGKK